MIFDDVIYEQPPTITTDFGNDLAQKNKSFQTNKNLEQHRYHQLSIQLADQNCPQSKSQIAEEMLKWEPSPQKTGHKIVTF